MSVGYGLCCCDTASWSPVIKMTLNGILFVGDDAADVTDILRSELSGSYLGNMEHYIDIPLVSFGSSGIGGLPGVDWERKLGELGGGPIDTSFDVGYTDRLGFTFNSANSSWNFRFWNHVPVDSVGANTGAPPAASVNFVNDFIAFDQDELHDFNLPNYLNPIRLSVRNFDNKPAELVDYRGNLRLIENGTNGTLNNQRIVTVEASPRPTPPPEHARLGNEATLGSALRFEDEGVSFDDLYVVHSNQYIANRHRANNDDIRGVGMQAFIYWTGTKWRYASRLGWQDYTPHADDVILSVVRRSNITVTESFRNVTMPPINGINAGFFSRIESFVSNGRVMPGELFGIGVGFFEANTTPLFSRTEPFIPYDNSWPITGSQFAGPVNPLSDTVPIVYNAEPPNTSRFSVPMHYERLYHVVTGGSANLRANLIVSENETFGEEFGFPFRNVQVDLAGITTFLETAGGRTGSRDIDRRTGQFTRFEWEEGQSGNVIAYADREIQDDDFYIFPNTDDDEVLLGGVQPRFASFSSDWNFDATIDRDLGNITGTFACRVRRSHGTPRLASTTVNSSVFGSSDGGPRTGFWEISFRTDVSCSPDAFSSVVAFDRALPNGIYVDIDETFEYLLTRTLVVEWSIHRGFNDNAALLRGQDVAPVGTGIAELEQAYARLEALRTTFATNIMKQFRMKIDTVETP